MSGLQKKETAAAVYWWDPTRIAEPDEPHFQPSWWQEQDRVVGSSTGRNVAWFVQGEQGNMVLRHYYRGGLVGKVLTDQFWLESVEKSRAMREFQLLQWMADEGLPVPRPCAARYARRGLIYRADLLIEMIPNSRDIFRMMTDQGPLDSALWQSVGATVRAMHDKGVYHSDLNCHNIMLDSDNKVWLIDFDKCERREPGEWQQANCERLLRSLRKELTKNDSFGWKESDWSAFMAGYQGTHAA
ncbi:3-deoxy-D-manno-octulosonic acid kinase [Aliidiomarina halalkaliphila]|uniref:3-deoxy-D-manno-octulosonic acid kinase n=1 Tax=Aliidiomarina halalkaliphila TaxID=2593535 RepID=A0A552X549_9GAMM|nr:3-deoxy-D-manno-octulosonic acid kinase [Aliidiomarina halalkaliphila]TRW50152.1 3-deoxy-D-manno-octulosonic acid kinase [Aliidiomarina halalkaliphila]